MQELQGGLDEHRVGDKVRIRGGIQRGARGIVQALADGQLEVHLSTGEVDTFLPNQLTNYSLAARRAWKSMPKRAGRPQLTVQRKKMVSLRIDVEVWDRLGKAVENGLIKSREQVVNAWLREKTEKLFEETLGQHLN